MNSMISCPHAYSSGANRLYFEIADNELQSLMTLRVIPRNGALGERGGKNTHGMNHHDVFAQQDTRYTSVTDS